MITVLTITAREEPMFEEMARSLYKAEQTFECRLCDGGGWVDDGEGDVTECTACNNDTPDWEWLVVDAKLWDRDGRAERKKKLLYAVFKMPVNLRHVEPKLSKWHGPGRDNTVTKGKDLPDTNGARNTGLIHAKGDYLVLLDDCSVVGPHFFSELAYARFRGHAARLLHHYEWTGDTGVLEGRNEDPAPCEPTAFRGSAVGYPLDKLIQVNGWDEIYAGQKSGNDVELAVRIARVGTLMMSYPRGAVCEYPQGHTPLFSTEGNFTEINDARLDAVQNDASRIKPECPTQPDIKAERAAQLALRHN